DAPGIYRNEGTAPRLAVRLTGEPPNSAGIGAQIKIHGGPVEQSQEMICGGRDLSGDQALRGFAVGKGNRDLKIEVIWRSGKRSLISAEPNFLYEIDESRAEEVQSSKSSVVSGQSSAAKDNQAAASTTDNGQSLFEDVSSLLSHHHHEEP